MDNQQLTFIVDVDGTLCPIKQENQRYEDLVPYMEIVEKIREYKAIGTRIILYTSRNMRSYGGNIGLINAHTAPVMLEWLKKWDIPYDEIIFGKPWPGHEGYYVDDRAIRPQEFLKSTPEDLKCLCRFDGTAE